jgi:REP element-mobilizing transposase RayT
MREIVSIEKGCYYHIYNRGINGEDIFKEARNYEYFLKRWEKYIEPIAETYAYCLLKNHFHALVYVKDEDVFVEIDNIKKQLIPALQFSHFFNSYAQSINKAYSRTGALFEHPFKRKIIDNETYFSKVIAYIHINPQKHGFIEDYRFYTHSSYGFITKDQPSFIKKDKLNSWFTGRKGFESFHQIFEEKQEDKFLYIED